MTKANCIAVPLDSLGMESGEGMEETRRVLPQVGDPINVQVSGTVRSVEGGTAQVQMESINGAPVPVRDEGSAMRDEGFGERELRRAAAKYDREAGY